MALRRETADPMGIHLFKHEGMAADEPEQRLEGPAGTHSAYAERAAAPSPDAAYRIRFGAQDPLAFGLLLLFASLGSRLLTLSAIETTSPNRAR